MTTAPTPSSPETLELGITRFIDAAPEKLFRAWTEPELMKQWFCPPPWKVVHAE
ncbi:MAG: SRPBCC domain-containing protein, partial [Ottowia sp.]|nr:SRPBCC domain-containing protein [Ottowia sp.]